MRYKGIVSLNSKLNAHLDGVFLYSGLQQVKARNNLSNGTEVARMRPKFNPIPQLTVQEGPHLLDQYTQYLGKRYKV